MLTVSYRSERFKEIRLLVVVAIHVLEMKDNVVPMNGSGICVYCYRNEKPGW